MDEVQFGLTERQHVVVTMTTFCNPCSHPDKRKASAESIAFMMKALDDTHQFNESQCKIKASKFPFTSSARGKRILTTTIMPCK